MKTSKAQARVLHVVSQLTTASASSHFGGHGKFHRRGVTFAELKEALVAWHGVKRIILRATIQALERRGLLVRVTGRSALRMATWKLGIPQQKEEKS